MKSSSRLKAPVGRYADVEFEKLEGSHYTPHSLARFVAKQIVASMPEGNDVITVLDPAIGDGELILGLLRELATQGRKRVRVHGFDTSEEALNIAQARIKAEYPQVDLQLSCENFLDFVIQTYRHNMTGLFAAEPARFDAVIANPPYVRTQVLGASQAQQIARQFNLSGRVDLYHAFLLAIAEVLKPGGVAGVIVSNRFMTTKSGAAVREDILKQFHVQHIWDLGDTKIFSAAVLPAVLLLNRKDQPQKQSASYFTSIYASKQEGTLQHSGDILDGLATTGIIANENGERFLVDHGTLDYGQHPGNVWRIKTAVSTDWLQKVQAHSWGKFSDLGKIRVGVKTTADKVFIRSDWDQMAENQKPELLKPLITHHIARRFRSQEMRPGKQILYPHAVIAGKRIAVPLEQYPRAARYLEQHRTVLAARKYVIDSGRNWYEIWVPQDPAVWEAPKLVFRDISARPEFWIDLSGGVVNGDCYWLVCNNRDQEDLLWLALAVGNSTFAEAFYDRCFCNKLYAGRRRFCTQYVEHFPLPDPSRRISQRMIQLAKKIFHNISSPQAELLEAELDA